MSDSIKILLLLLLAGGAYYLYTNSNTPAPGTLPATGQPGQTIVLGGITYSWLVNGVGGWIGDTGWHHLAI